jgi:aspartate 1-decarboxylase
LNRRNIRRFKLRGKTMQRIMKKSKIHTAAITGLELYYEGSITIDSDLLDMADMLPGEQVQVVNLNNGERFITYTISGERGSGVIELNGPAARLAAIGDKVIIISYGNYDNAEAQALKPIVLFVDENNRAVRK